MSKVSQTVYFQFLTRLKQMTFSKHLISIFIYLSNQLQEPIQKYIIQMDEQQLSIDQVSLTSQQQVQEQPEHDFQDQYNCMVQLQKDLQFVQMLANPQYIIQLHVRGYLYDQNFQNYICNGLKYLNSEKYIPLIKYPEGLLNLERIRSKGFAQFLKNPQNVTKFKKFCIQRNQMISNNSH